MLLLFFKEFLSYNSSNSSGLTSLKLKSQAFISSLSFNTLISLSLFSLMEEMVPLNGLANSLTAFSASTSINGSPLLTVCPTFGRLAKVMSPNYSCASLVKPTQYSLPLNKIQRFSFFFKCFPAILYQYSFICFFIKTDCDELFAFDDQRTFDQHTIT